jgi:hypothetical protein
MKNFPGFRLAHEAQISPGNCSNQTPKWAKAQFPNDPGFRLNVARQADTLEHYSEVVWRQTTENFIRCLERTRWHER